MHSLSKSHDKRLYSSTNAYYVALDNFTNITGINVFSIYNVSQKGRPVKLFLQYFHLG